MAGLLIQGFLEEKLKYYNDCLNDAEEQKMWELAEGFKECKKLIIELIALMKSDNFKEWYLEYREEMAKVFNVNYAICIASWTFADSHKKYYIKGLTPKDAVLEYISEKTI